MTMLKVDEFEPVNILTLLQQTHPDLIQTALNRSGFADYVWELASPVQGDIIEQAERKQVAEILSDMTHVEEQLRGEIERHPNTILIVEGIAEPTPSRGIRTFNLTPNGRGFRPGKEFNTPYERFEGWLISLERVGIVVWRTSSWMATARSIHQWYSSAQRTEHQALQRYLKTRPLWMPNPQVESLMNIKKGGVGPERAERLIEVFGTVWDVLRQDPDFINEMVPGMGLTAAKKLLNAAGRKFE
jgi:hypothetical protein